MEDIMDFCADLVTDKSLEPFPIELFRSHIGQWRSVTSICKEACLNCPPEMSTVFATWLRDPLDNEDFAMIMFVDSDSMKSLAAHYNRQRLLGNASPPK